MPTHKYKRGVYAAMMLVALKAMSGCDSANSAIGSTSGPTGHAIPPSPRHADVSMEGASQAMPASLHGSHAEARHFEAYSLYQMMFDDATGGSTTVANSSSIERSLNAGNEDFAGAGAIGACLASIRHERDQDQD